MRTLSAGWDSTRWECHLSLPIKYASFVRDCWVPIVTAVVSVGTFRGSSPSENNVCLLFLTRTILLLTFGLIETVLIDAWISGAGLMGGGSRSMMAGARSVPPAVPLEVGVVVAVCVPEVPGHGLQVQVTVRDQYSSDSQNCPQVVGTAMSAGHYFNNLVRIIDR